MNLLLVGASSFIGREIYRQAKGHGYRVVGTATRPQNPEWYSFNLKDGDIRDVLRVSGMQDCLDRGEKVFAIITAFYCGNERTVTNLKEAQQVNIIGMERLLDTLHELGIKALFFSTECVFSGRDGKAPYREDYPTDPVLAYGRHKAEIECYIQEHMPEMLIYRLSQNISTEPDGIQIFSDVYERQKSESHFHSIQGQVIAPTYIADTAKWAIEGLKRGLSGIYHCENPESMPRAELVRRFLAAIGSEAEVEEVPLETFGFKESRTMDVRLDCTKLQQAIPELSFKPVDEVIEEFVRKLPG
ncbi:MAG: NAD-dependent epimerase/dehydratase family protein [Selenomonas ruminantium]|nr:NAD-dependent epimerase/dehydratase family protein [Selenomonas ruminantium]